VGASLRSAPLVGIAVLLLGGLLELARYIIGLQQKQICISFSGAPCTSSTPVIGAPHFSISHWVLFCAVIAIGASVGTLIRKRRRWGDRP
jgi:hypothetical protein